jgi:SHS2 domain-containing protein
MYETFEHTADLGLRARAADLDTLFAETALALFTAIVEDPYGIEEKVRIDMELAEDDREFLLFDWLKTLLYQMETEQLLFRRFEVHVRDDGLLGSAWGEPFDPDRHHYAHEVKAITYHGLRVEKVGDLWEAEVIVDI